MGKSKICESQIVTTKEQKYPKHSAKCIHPSMWYIYYVSAFCGKADAFENGRRKLFFDSLALQDFQESNIVKTLSEAFLIEKPSRVLKGK